jgi:hypothetical protein
MTNDQVPMTKVVAFHRSLGQVMGHYRYAGVSGGAAA